MVENFPEDEYMCRKRDGTVLHVNSDSENEDWWESDSDFTDESDLEEEWNRLESIFGQVNNDLNPDEVLQNLREWCSLEMDREVEELLKANPYEVISEKKTAKVFKSAEINRGLGYNGQSDRTKRKHVQKAREEEKNAVTRNS